MQQYVNKSFESASAQVSPELAPYALERLTEVLAAVALVGETPGEG